jgi:cytochrome P450
MTTVVQSPPGPLNMNSALGLTWRHAVSFWWDPTRFFTRLASRYGDIVHFQMFSHRCYLVNRPEWIWQIFVTKRDAFTKWPQQSRVLRSLLGNSVLITEGEIWRQQRGELLPFFSPSALKYAGQSFIKAAAGCVSSWDCRESGDIEPELDQLLVKTTLEGMFGYDVGDQAPRLVEAVRVISRSGNEEMFELLPIPDHWPLRYKRRKLAAVSEIKDLVRSMLRSSGRSAAYQSFLENGNREGLSESAIIDHMVTVFVAAVHTTSAWISWTIKLLAREPQWQERIAAEFRLEESRTSGEFTECPKLPSLDRVLQESLRLCPPVWALMARQAVCDVRFGEYTVPRGGVIFVLPQVTHRDVRFYPDPMRFDPDRFLPEAESQRPRGSFIPFGLGPHQCPGAALARLQAQSIVGSLIAQFEIRPLFDETFRARTHLAVRPRDGVRIALLRRP